MKPFRRLLAALSPLVAASCATLVGFPDVPDPGEGGAENRPDSSAGNRDASETVVDARTLEDRDVGSTDSEASIGNAEGAPPPIVPGDGSADASCAAQTSQVLATKITFTTAWSATAPDTAGSGTVAILLLTTLAGDQALTGSSRICSMIFPDDDLNATGMAAVGGGSKTRLQRAAGTWDTIGRTYAVTGTQSGWNAGDTQQLMPAVSLLGLQQTSPYATDTTAWPSDCTTCLPSGSFALAYVQDDDGDGQPGITLTALQATGYSLVPTSFAANAPLADQVYVALRTEIALSVSRGDCTTLAGTATLRLFDSHVVGCHVASGACSEDQVSFLDANRAAYSYDPTPGDAVSASHPLTGAASSVTLPAAAACADARAAFSPTFD